MKYIQHYKSIFIGSSNCSIFHLKLKILKTIMIVFQITYYYPSLKSFQLFISARGLLIRADIFFVRL